MNKDLYSDVLRRLRSFSVNFYFGIFSPDRPSLHRIGPFGPCNRTNGMGNGSETGTHREGAGGVTQPLFVIGEEISGVIHLGRHPNKK